MTLEAEEPACEALEARTRAVAVGGEKRTGLGDEEEVDGAGLGDLLGG